MQSFFLLLLSERFALLASLVADSLHIYVKNRREEKLDSLSPQLNADRYLSKNRNFVTFFLEVKLSAERNTILLLSGPKETKLIFSKYPFGEVPVYCHMSRHGLGACGGGGWTLVMKIDGNKVSHDNQLFADVYVGICT